MLEEDHPKLLRLHERQRLARCALLEAYERRDTLTGTLAAATVRGVEHQDLQTATTAAENAVRNAETDLKDAEYALASTIEALASAALRHAGES
ncbi:MULTISPECIES: hypothetical protein [Methylorubrum]|uniref:Uncharacterized protein n=1 Tax=Methylorubrum zatmanii TaxID=29429 RepID=A0ABW1X0E8_9HYPH|nr:MULTISPECIES: hypothetical protein [Bacteria]MBL7405223.1 hypothetical protein [Escherichia coli]MBL7478347.1 hypothetical protein [Bacillus paralicheniformis]MDV2988271.1 hypothetical protein [Methylobacteriaceae bacterium AG10]MBD8907757.1 hypothetical protein [Methylorubrum zatmanii]MCP1546682.1 hypothetical protein [Methylorubrum extorquens]